MFGVDTKGKLLGLTNTSVSTVLLDGGEPRVSVFNDTTHLPGDPVRGEPGLDTRRARQARSDGGESGRAMARPDGGNAH